MAIKYREQPLYESMIEASYGLAKTLPSRGKQVDISRFKNIPMAVNRTGVSPAAIMPSSLKNLGKISVPYGEQTRYEQFHKGLDIANVIGTKIPAFQSGTVTSVQTPAQSGGFGLSTIVTDAQGNKWRYSHLNRSYVKVNEQIGAGSIIGEMGISGNVYSLNNPNNPEAASHLDLRILDAAKKYYINPMTLID